MKLRQRRIKRNRTRQPSLEGHCFSYNERWIGANVRGDPIRRYGEVGCMVEGDDGEMHSLTGPELKRAVAYFNHITGTRAMMRPGA